MQLNPTVVLTIAALVLMFAFPKAGFYVGATPVTAGYFALAALAAAQILTLAMRNTRISTDRFVLGLLLAALGVVQMVAFARFGYDSVGGLMSIVVSSLVIPPLTLLAAGWVIERLGLPLMIRVLTACLLIVFAYGVLSFVVFNVFGKMVGIPFLTTTGADMDMVALRHNMRGSVIKMFSTYNNGNVLGVNILLWGPIVATTLPTSGMFRGVALLTLSRSVWAGLLVYEFAIALTSMQLRRWMTGILLLAVIGCGAWMATIYMGVDPSKFLIDRQLGGRIEGLDQSLHRGLSNRTAWLSESLYASAYLAFGAAGVILMLAAWLLPILRGNRSDLALRCRIAMAVYLFVAIVEGAFNLVPTQMSYWFVAAIAMHPHTAAATAGIPATSKTPRQTPAKPREIRGGFSPATS